MKLLNSAEFTESCKVTRSIVLDSNHCPILVMAGTVFVVVGRAGEMNENAK